MPRSSNFSFTKEKPCEQPNFSRLALTLSLAFALTLSFKSIYVCLFLNTSFSLADGYTSQDSHSHSPWPAGQFTIVFSLKPHSVCSTAKIMYAILKSKSKSKRKE